MIRNATIYLQFYVQGGLILKNREFNILKGLGIIAVVIGHSSWRFGKIFDPYSFHMALFIFISGYFYKTTYEDNFILFIKNKTKSLVIPYFIYNFFMLF